MCMRLEQGGVVLKRSRLGALRSHQRVSLLVPVSPPITDVMSGGSGDRQNQTHWAFVDRQSARPGCQPERWLAAQIDHGRILANLQLASHPVGPGLVVAIFLKSNGNPRLCRGGSGSLTFKGFPVVSSHSHEKEPDRWTSINAKPHDVGLQISLGFSPKYRRKVLYTPTHWKVGKSLHLRLRRIRMADDSRRLSQ